MSILKVSGSTQKIESQHSNLRDDTESFDFYLKSLRTNSQI